MAGELAPRPGESAADFKKRIEAAQGELAKAKPAASAPVSAPEPKPAEPVTAPQPKDPATPPVAEKPAQPAAPAQAPAAPPQPTPSAPDDKVDHLEWAKKKGLKSPEDIARSLRNLEQEFHRRNQARPPAPPAPPQPSDIVPNVPPAYQPTSNLPRPPAYRPAPQAPQEIIQAIAETYQLDLEDAKRLLPLIDDMTEAKVRARESELLRRFGRVERDQARNNELFRLAQEPSFSHPAVQFEMHRILSDNPQVFEVEPAPYTYAYNQAMVNLARQHYSQSVPADQAPEPQAIPNRPPANGGATGSSGETGKTGETIDHAKFSGLPLEKKRELLTAIGARPPQ